MKKLVTITLIALIFAGCSKENKDTTEFKQIMIGCWKPTDENSTNYFYCFDENTVSIYDQEYDVLKESYQYVIRSDEDDIYLDFQNSEISWIIVNYSQDSLSYEDTRLGTSDDVQQLTRLVD